MNKTIKKIVALGMGAAMLGSTLGFALAADLSAYPSPFVKDGAFVGKIVIGERAASIDTVGAMDVAASLQRASSVAVGGTGSTGSSAAADGYKFSGSTDLVRDSTLVNVTTSIDDTDLPVLLASGTIEADDGTEYDYDVEVDLTSSDPVVSADVASNSDLEDLGYTTPIVFFDTTPTTGLLYTTTIDFIDTWSPSDFVNSETIELFGTQYTFDPDNTNSDDVLTLYGSETTLLIAKGTKETVTYKGKEYTIEVLGGNSDDSSAIVRINGDTRTLTEGDSKTMPSGGLPVYAKNVFVSNIGGDDVSIQLFIGSNKLELDVDGTVTKNAVELEGVTVLKNGVTTAGNWSNTDSISFEVTPKQTDDEIDFILPGKSYVDPVFGAFKFEFVGASDLMAGKDLVSVTRNSDAVDLTFTPRNAPHSVTVTLLKNNLTTAAEVDLFRGTMAVGQTVSNLSNLVEDQIFFYNDNTDVKKAVTHVLQITKIKDGNNTDDTDFEVVVKDLSHDKTYTVTDLTSTLSNDVALYLSEGSDADHISFATTANNGSLKSVVSTVYTEAGAAVLITGLTNITSPARLTPTISVLEDVDADYDTILIGDLETFNITPVYDLSDREYDISVNNADDYGTDDNVDYYLSKFGTYVAEETDDSGAYVKLYVPAVEVTYDAFLMPVNSEVTISSATTGGAVALNPISVGMAILDSEASLGSKPYIVIGGPCANTVAAALMGNPADCAAGFTEGKAMIKLFSDKNALLVAGYSGKDTQGACRVLSNYNNPMYALSGSEVEVVTANLQSLSVKKVSS